MNDFERNVWCVLGMPIDVDGFDKVCDRIVTMVARRQRCFMSTPNLNFAITARRDRNFRDSVVLSDLVVLDGMLPVWLAKLLGVPGIAKISGADLFDALRQRSIAADDNAIKLYLFGGQAGVSETACAAINQSDGGFHCVGYHNPGFGSVEDMSHVKILDEINSSDADFVLVALGAHKGQAWIVANRAKLEAPVLVHLGAVVNFAAGHVARAPAWMQNCGMEWVWRICQEPSLWRRYFNDALALGPLLLTEVFPAALQCRLRLSKAANSLSCDIEREANSTKIRLTGSCQFATILRLREVLRHETLQSNAIEIDLTSVKSIDNAFLGLCLLLYKQSLMRKFELSFSGANRSIRRAFRWNGVGYLLSN